MDKLYLNIIAGIAAGLLRAVLGYLGRPEDEPFRPKAFLRSVIIASLAGALIGYQLNSDPIATFFAALGVDWLATKAIMSPLSKKLEHVR